MGNFGLMVITVCLQFRVRGVMLFWGLAGVSTELVPGHVDHVLFRNGERGCDVFEYFRKVVAFHPIKIDSCILFSSSVAIFGAERPDGTYLIHFLLRQDGFHFRRLRDHCRKDHLPLRRHHGHHRHVVLHGQVRRLHVPRRRFRGFLRRLPLRRRLHLCWRLLRHPTRDRLHRVRCRHN